MRPALRVPTVALIIACLSYSTPARAADETSSGDKLRMLYSNQFTFTDDGLPLVTIELDAGRNLVELDAKAGLVVRPDGDSGPAIEAGKQWTITVKDSTPAQLREWTVVGRFHPDQVVEIDREQKQWQSRGYSPRSFEIGTVFGVAGDVLDSRELLIAVAPTPLGRGDAKAAAIAKKFGVDTSVHTEVVRLPRGTVVAKSGEVTIENPSVIWFYPKGNGETIRVRDISVGGGGSQLTLKKEDRRYLGGVFVTVGKDGKLVVVNAVSADRLLAGIVPSEIFPSAPQAALEAQAVAARTELLEKLGRRHFGDPFLLCSSQSCQVYSGAGKEHPRTTAAVRATRGVVLMGRDRSLVDARYSAACGGHGENNEHIWGGKPNEHLRGRVDAIPDTKSHRLFKNGITAHNLQAFLDAPANEFYEGATRFGAGRFRWEKTLTAAELSELVRKHYPQVGRVLALEASERGRSGRARRLHIRGTEGSAVANGDLHIRRLFGGLRSTLFMIDAIGPKEAPHSFRFRGAGFGHGVGMCQVGAIGMAEKGLSSSEILRHFYAGASLKRLY